MIPDSVKNFIYLADTLERKFPIFYSQFTNAIANAGIDWGIVEGTSDIWTVDYMPVQLSENSFVKYIFKPDYLMDRRYSHLLADSDQVWSNLQFKVKEVSCDLVLDGGNLVYSKDTLIVTDKIFTENSDKTKSQILRIMEKSFQARIIVIRRAKGDIFGHADGEVRFINADTVLVNEQGLQIEYFNGLTGILKKNNLNYICVPCKCLASGLNANGLYINYLQIGNIIFLPVFDIEADEMAIRFFENVFIGCNIIPVKANQIAKTGGVLRCVSWGIMI